MHSMYWLLVGFIAGSIPFSLWIGKIALHTDIRTVGDGNPGGTNVWKAGGRFWAILAVLLDGFKGAIPVGLAHYVNEINGWMLIPVALAPLLGHMFSPFLKFHGGKGMATTFGIWLGLTSWLGPTVLGLSFFTWRRILKTDRAVIVAGLLTLLVILTATSQGLIMAIICLANLGLVWWAYGRNMTGE